MTRQPSVGGSGLRKAKKKLLRAIGNEPTRNPRMARGLIALRLRDRRTLADGGTVVALHLLRFLAILAATPASSRSGGRTGVAMPVKTYFWNSNSDAGAPSSSLLTP